MMLMIYSDFILVNINIVLNVVLRLLISNCKKKFYLIDEYERVKKKKYINL